MIDRNKYNSLGFTTFHPKNVSGQLQILKLSFVSRSLSPAHFGENTEQHLPCIKRLRITAEVKKEIQGGIIVLAFVVVNDFIDLLAYSTNRIYL